VLDPAQELRTLIRQAGSDPEVASAAARLESLLDAALAQAEMQGMRLLARTVLYELAQPLTELRGYARLLVERSISAEEYPSILAWTEQAASRAGTLLHAIGRLERPDAQAPGRIVLNDQELLILPPESS
jgi:signal transduction histidine kinase